MPFLPYEIRDKHVHIIGKTGHGKSTLIAWQAVNDILSREGAVCVVDPKGDLLEVISRYIPDERIDQCLWIDLNHPIPLDFMSCKPGDEERVISDLTFILTRGVLDAGSSPNLASNIEALLWTLINANQHPDMPREQRCTFLDIYRFFREPERQRFILRHVTNKSIAIEWTEENTPSKQDRERIVSRIKPFFLSPTFAAIFGDPTPKLNIDAVIDNKQILLIHLPLENPKSSDYGSLLISKLQHAIFSRPRERRVPVFLYVDEFQNFRASADFNKLLTMARSFKLCFTLANLRLEELDKTIKSALTIISTYILLRLSPEDASYYKPIIEEDDPYADLRAMKDRINLEYDLTPNASQNEKLRYKRETLYKMSDGLPPRTVTIKDALTLPEFKAIYKIGNQPAIIEATPNPPSEFPTPEQERKTTYIKRRTLAEYGPSPYAYSAQSGKKRTLDISSSQEDEKMFGLEHHDSRARNEDTDIEPTKEVLRPVPHHRDKGKPPKSAR